MDEQRYHEILPVAYLAAAIEKGGRPTPRSVGLYVRDIVATEDAKSPAYRIAMAAVIPAEIISVEKKTVSLGDRTGEKFHIVFESLTKERERQDINTPLLSDFRFGKMTKDIWDRWEPDGTNYWVGKRMNLYKHNDPPREGDKSSAGFRCCVYAEPRNN